MPALHKPRYSVRAATGILGATLAAGAAVFAMQNGASARPVWIYRIQASFTVTDNFTAASQVLFVGDRFDSDTFTGGADYSELIHGKSGPSTIADVRASTTAALTDPGAISYDDTPIPLVGAGVAQAGVTHPGFDLDLTNDPIQLVAGQGFAIVNSVAWPAAGTGVLQAAVSWFG